MKVRELQAFLDRVDDKDADIIVWLDYEDSEGYAALDTVEFTVSSDGITKVTLNPVL